MAPVTRCEVAVVGAGIAGLAACVLLRRQGRTVVCFDPLPHPHAKVGESLDWSSPALLRLVGVDPERLIVDGVATWKRNIVGCELGREEWTATPPPVIRRRPLRFETVTLHVDRTALDGRLCEVAQRAGAELVWERVREVDHDGDRVRGLVTSAGTRVEARWFVDASGTARVLARAMEVPVVAFGPRKVCFWTYFDTPPLRDGTVFYVDNEDRYLSWVWEIPITPTRTSVGLVLPAEAVGERRRAGETPEAILRGELARHPRFAALLDRAGPLEVESTAFHPSVASRVAGENWLMAGEAAAMPDPLTGNGVTSGIRHARWAAEALAAAGGGDAIPRRVRRRYGRHVLRLGRSFNAHIEEAVYESPLRRGLGLEAATTVYTGFAFFINALYARFDPRRATGMAAFDLLFAIARGWIRGSILFARALLWWRSARRADG